ncbi:MAG: helix-turn-helix domain-containing protein [Streptosporangiales bacterium]|nr:helix-turn-helix domain-containing protein [Streptosporangiales bacterium]
MSEGKPPREPLAGHEVLRSSRLDEVREAGARLFAPHHLTLLGRDARLDTRLNAVQIGSVTIGWVRYGAGVRIVVDEMAGSYQVNVPLTGRMEISSAGETITSTSARPALLLPGGSYVGRWSDECEQLAVNVDRAALETELEHLLGRPVAAPIRFEFGMDLGDPTAQSWLTALRLVVSESERPGSLVQDPRAARHIEHLLTTGLLLSQPHNYSSALLEPQPTPGPRAVRQAIEVIESNLDQPLTAPDLASAVGVSVRALQEGFRRYVGVPPMSYLREMRLARVHEELATAEPDSSLTVTSVACRWGFLHLGRFAGAYQKKYGVLPSQTLHADAHGPRPPDQPVACNGLAGARNG